MPNTARPATIVPTPSTVNAEKPSLRLRTKAISSQAAPAHSKISIANMACLLQTVPRRSTVLLRHVRADELHRDRNDRRHHQPPGLWKPPDAIDDPTTKHADSGAPHAQASPPQRIGLLPPTKAREQRAEIGQVGEHQR